jgi:hypothetical protein
MPKGFEEVCLSLCSALAVAVLLPASAFGQALTVPTYIGMTPEDVGVMDLARPEYDAKGIPLGGFRLFPTMTVSANYDDNAFRQPTAQSDWFFEETPQLRLQSQWGRHFLEIYGGADNYNYDKFGHLNLTDWTTGADGRLDISRAFTASAAGSYGEYHESLESPNTVGFQESPNRYYKGHGEVTATYQPSALGFSAGASVDRYDWLDTQEIGGGTLSNGDRNETESQAYLKSFYVFSPGYAGFIKASYDDRSFDDFFDRSHLHRASNGYRVDGGLNVQLTHLIAGEFYLGYLEQHYAQDVPTPLTNLSGLDYGVTLNWYATPVLTVRLTGSRTINDVIIDNASATDDKSIKLGADYEFRRDIIVQAHVSYIDSSFIGLSRRDEYPEAGVSVRYLMNRYMSWDLGYDYGERSSNSSGVDFKDNTVTLALNLHV